MKRILLPISLIYFSLAIISCHSTRETQAKSNLSNTESSMIASKINALMLEQQECWNMKDLACFTSYYADKAYSCIVGNEGPICGQDSIALIYEKSYPPEKMGRLEFSELDIHPLSNRIVLVRGKYTLDQEDAFFQSGWYTLVWEKFEEGWKIISDHTG